MNTIIRGNILLSIVGGGSLLLLCLAGLFFRFTRPLHPQSISAAASVAPEPRCTALYYAESLQNGALKYDVPEVTLEAMRQPLRGGREFRGARALPARGGTMTTAHLRLSTSLRRLSSSSDGAEGFRADHLVLNITNRTGVPLAYRVITSVSDPEQCGRKAELRHNVIAILPHQTLQRTECFFHDKQHVTVKQIDVYEVSELGYHYLSHLSPIFGPAFDERVSRWHDPGEAPCDGARWLHLARGDDPWHALIDFYARHDCDVYSPPTGYRPFTRPGELPACQEVPPLER